MLINLQNEEDVWKATHVDEDFTERVIMRYKLYPFLKKLKYDRLMVDGQDYTYDCDNARPALARK